MASTTINADGSITITMSPQEQQLAQLLLATRGPDFLTDVFNLWFDNAVQPIFTQRFSQLAVQDQVDFLTKISSVKSP